MEASIETIQVLGDRILLQEVKDPQNQSVLSEVAASLISPEQKAKIESEKRMENMNQLNLWLLILVLLLRLLLCQEI